MDTEVEWKYEEQIKESWRKGEKEIEVVNE
jgi:hypothetical protein